MFGFYSFWYHLIHKSGQVIFTFVWYYCLKICLKLFDQNWFVKSPPKATAHLRWPWWMSVAMAGVGFHACGRVRHGQAQALGLHFDLFRRAGGLLSFFDAQTVTCLLLLRTRYSRSADSTAALLFNLTMTAKKSLFRSLKRWLWKVPWTYKLCIFWASRLLCM
jgi:hypothetical protein